MRITVSSEEEVWLALQQCLLLGFVPDEDHGDVGANVSWTTWGALGIRPGEAVPLYPEIESITRDLHNPRKRQGDGANIFGVRQRDSSLSPPRSQGSPRLPFAGAGLESDADDTR